jgi:hypothetical protein
MFDFLVLLVLFGSFVFYSPIRVDGDELWSLYGLAFIAVLPFFIGRKERKVELKWIGIVLMAAMASIFFNITGPVKSSFANLLTGCFALKAISENSNLTPKLLGKFLAWFLVLTGVVISLQFAGIDPLFFHQFKGEVTGTFTTTWALGCFAALTVPFLFSWNPSACLLAIPALYFSRSSAAVFFAVLMFLFMLRRFSFRLIGVGIILALSYICFFDAGVDTARFAVMQGSLKYLSSFVHGNGIGSWAHEGFIRLNGADNYYWRFAHNELFQMYFETGVIGLLATAGAIVMFLKTKSRALLAAVIGLLAISCFHSPFHYGRLSVFGVIILALALKESSNARA